MNWHRISNYQWDSDCGRYRIQALVAPHGVYDFAACYVLAPKHLHGLGIYRSPDSQTNAKAAKHACLKHAQQHEAQLCQ